jgi:hypothetical protein
MNAFYDIHGLRVRLTGLADAAVPDINGKLHAFTASDDGAAADIEVAIGDFKPNLEGCLALDRRYWARPGYFYLEERDKGLSWRAEIVGLDRDPGTALRVRFAHGPRNRYRMPWGLFPDLVAHLYVLWPLLECELAARGLYLVHAGGVEKNGRATLIAGRGGVNKTAIVAELVRRGWRPLGDDFVLLGADGKGGARVLAMPTSPRWFEFQLRHMQDEDLSLVDKVRLFCFLYRKHGATIEFGREARLEKLVLVDQVEDCREPAAEPMTPAVAADRLALNCRMERIAYVGHGTIIGRFLDAYRYVVPESPYGRAWDGLEEALAGMTGGVRHSRMAAPRRYDRRLADAVESC